MWGVWARMLVRSPPPEITIAHYAQSGSEFKSDGFFFVWIVAVCG